MLSYWILRHPDGTPAGLVRVQNDRVLLKPTVPIAGTFTVFSDTASAAVQPESELHFPGAMALIGTDGESVTCIAAAPNAAPIAHYRKLLSQNCTKSEYHTETNPAVNESEPIVSQNSPIHIQEDPVLGEQSSSISPNSTKKIESVSETAQETQAFSLLLQHAAAFYDAYESNSSANNANTLVQNTDNREEGGIDLFSQEYPGARWRYVDGTDILPYYEGMWHQPGGQTLHILAVRGRAAPRPPRALFGFTRFLRDRDGTGYWLRLTPLP